MVFICRIKLLNCKIIIKNIAQLTKTVILKCLVKNSPMLWIMHFMHAFDWNSRFYWMLAVVDVSKCIHRWNFWKWWKKFVDTSANFQMWAECDFHFYLQINFFHDKSSSYKQSAIIPLSIEIKKLLSISYDETSRNFLSCKNFYLINIMIF